MIDSVWIRDFRGIHTAHVTGLRSINVLVGPNNSGKTAFLEALYLGCGVNGADYIPAVFGRDRCEVQLPTTDFVGEQPVAMVRRKHLHQPNKQGMIRTAAPPIASQFRVTIRTEFPGSGPLHELKLYPVFAALQEDWPPHRLQHLAYCRFAIEHMAAGGTKSYLSGVLGPPADLGLSVKQPIFFWDRSFTYHHSSMATWELFGTPMAVDLDEVRILPAAKHTFFYDGQQTLAHIPTDFYINMISVVPGWSQKIAERVGRVLGITEPFNVLFMPTGPNKEWMQGQIAFADRPALPIDDFGDGARAVFKVLAPLIALAELVTEQEPGIFLWEEPELFQNPLTLGRLLAEVADLAQSCPLQVFMATHSLEVVAHLVQQVQAGTLKEEALCTLRTQLHKGDFTAHSFSTDDIRTWTRMQRDLRVPDGFTGSPLHFSIEGPAGSDAASDDGDGDE